MKPRPIAMTICALAMSGCAAPPRPAAGPIPIYARLDDGVSRLDVDAAIDLINVYRGGRKLALLTRDSALEADAARRAGAAVGRIQSGAGMPRAPTIGENSAGQNRAAHVTAGYRTFAEAFSGWRESPAHEMAMSNPQARRIGLSAIAAPGTRYGVYWAIVTGP